MIKARDINLSRHDRRQTNSFSILTFFSFYARNPIKIFHLSFSVFHPANALRVKRQDDKTEKKEESFEQELCKDKDAGEWFRLVANDGDACRDVIQCTTSVSFMDCNKNDKMYLIKTCFLCAGSSSYSLPSRALFRHREANMRLEGGRQKL